MKSPSTFTRLIRSSAERIAADPRVPAENRAALAYHAEHIIWAQWREIFGGDIARLRAPNTAPRERQDRSARIAQSIANGEPAVVIARRERVRPDAVRQQAYRLRNT